MKEITLGAEHIYQGHVINLRVDRVEDNEGKKTTREVVEHGGAVAIVAIDDSGNILMVRQYRYPVEKELLEIPAGGIDPGEDPAQAAARELQEEIGYFPQKLKRLGGFYSAPGFCTEYLHLYLATGLTYNPLVAEDTEDIEVVRIAPADIHGLITSGNICDAKSIAGLLSYNLYK